MFVWDGDIIVFVEVRRALENGLQTHSLWRSGSCAASGVAKSIMTLGEMM